MDPAEVKWSSSEFTLQGYVSKFSNSFPNIIKITEGFLGKQEIDSISASTVIRVNSVYNQRRVTAETKGGKLFSLPVKLRRLKFLVPQVTSPTATLKSPQAMTLEDIVAKFPLPVPVRISTMLSYKQKGDMKSHDEMLTELTLQDMYEETFLFGHPIEKGKFFVEEPIIVPMYMTELKLVVAFGFKNGDADKWNKLCNSFTHQVKNHSRAGNITFEEILMLDKKDVNPEEPSYSTIEPIYIDINLINSDFKTPVDNKKICNVYQYQIMPELKKLQIGQNPLKTSPSVGSLKSIKSSTPVESLKSIESAKPVESFKSIGSSKLVESFKSVGSLKSVESFKSVESLKPAESFKLIQDVPKDLHDLTVQQVCECLTLLNMSQYTVAFEASQVDGQLVYDLNQEMMKSCLGMNGLNIMKFLKFRNGWRPNLQE